MTHRVERLQDPDLIRAFLDRRRDAYMVGDLHEPYWKYSEFYGAFQDVRLDAIVLRFTLFNPPVIVSAGLPAAVDALYADLIRRGVDTILYHAAEDHLPAVQRYWVTRQAMSMFRMAISPTELQLPPMLERVRRLTPDDAELAEAMYQVGIDSGEINDGFHAPTFYSGIFFGVEQSGRLLSAAGTHIISMNERLGAVGHVFTRPEMRGQGFAAAVTAAVTAALFDQGIDLAVLNVRQTNTPALRIYQKLGYSIHNPLEEGIGVRLA